LRRVQAAWRHANASRQRLERRQKTIGRVNYSTLLKQRDTMTEVYTRTVSVTSFVDVTVEKAAFTDEFLAEFRRDFYPFYTIEDHIRHLGRLYVEGIAYNGCFIEGYGPADLMGISFADEEVADVEVLP
jgi:hypothetical protein